MWTLNNECKDIGTTNNWVPAKEVTYCNAKLRPNGKTAKCCCADGDILGCCEKKDKGGNITTANLTGENCKIIPYATTNFYQDRLAKNNRCVAKATAASGCSWKRSRLSLAVGKRCDTYQMKLSNNDNYADCALKDKTTIGTLSESSEIAVCCCPAEVVAAPKPTPPKFIMPELQISIPGLKLTPSSSIDCTTTPDGSYQVSIPWLSEYLLAIYNYGLAIAGILAAIMLMGGGVLWLISSGDASRITQAKELIAGSITGLIILMSSYIILVQINPDLNKFQPITIGTIKKIDLEGDNNSPNVTLDTQKIASKFGIKCGQDSVKQIVDKMKGNATYSQLLRTQSAPGGFIYFDCSSFAGFVLKCATDKNSGQRTADIFSGQKTWDNNINNLKPGDMIGWAPKNNKKGSGHVIIYLGNRVFGDCHGGSGKQPGNCVSSSISLETLKSYATSHSDGNLYINQY